MDIKERHVIPPMLMVLGSNGAPMSADHPAASDSLYGVSATLTFGGSVPIWGPVGPSVIPSSPECDAVQRS